MARSYNARLNDIRTGLPIANARCEAWNLAHTTIDETKYTSTTGVAAFVALDDTDDYDIKCCWGSNVVYFRAIFTMSGSIANSDTVDLIHASATAAANKLLALNASSKLPASITGDADTLDTYHYSQVGTDIATHAALTSTHGATGAIMGTTNTQEASAKTFTTSLVKITSLQESSTTSNLGQDIVDTWWSAQTFTPTASHTITSVKLYLYKLGTVGTITVGIRATAVGKPDGADIVSGTTDGNTLTTNTAGEEREITFGAGTALTAGTVYCIVTRLAAGDGSNHVHWRAHNAGSYTGGTVVNSTDSGSTWTISASADYVFGDYGSITGDMVGTSNVQTLTNKTITSPVIQGTVAAGTGLTMPSFTVKGEIAIHAHTADAVGTIFQSQKSRGTATVPVIVTTGDILSEDRSYGYDGANYLFMGASYFKSTGTIAATRVPTEWQVWIATDAAPSVLTIAARLSASVTAFGINTLTVNTGAENSAFGLNALGVNTTGLYGCAFGSGALPANTTGQENSAFGFESLHKCIDGWHNVAIGSDALHENTSGSYNCAMGLGALYHNTTALYNIAIGKEALTTNTTGEKNVAMGHQALYTNDTGSSNVAIGYMAGFYETASNALYIDNLPRANLADGKIKALIYGVFASAPANQLLTINANLVTSRDIAFTTSLDSVAVADEVSLGGFDIGIGHRALAISSEEVVVAEVDETKFSHKLPVRINGATYNIMLCAT